MESENFDIEGATPAQLIDMLYDRTLRDLTSAIELYKLEGDPRSQADAIHLIVHAQQIIAELNNSLNMKSEMDLATNLRRIYEYTQYRLTEAIAQRKVAPIEEVVSLLSELASAWKSILNRRSKGEDCP